MRLLLDEYITAKTFGIDAAPINFYLPDNFEKLLWYLSSRRSIIEVNVFNLKGMMAKTLFISAALSSFSSVDVESIGFTKSQSIYNKSIKGLYA